MKTGPLTTREDEPSQGKIENLQALLYADDIGTTAENIDGLKRHLDTVASVFKEHGLRINFSKT